uniref:regulator of G-protein signaling 21-like n=1 Tax=Scatophagus argus TaxID=75038 RepID=UPI001ED83A39|nr:regulator of G-protein signaling 21-like [Scatophagus argus]
MGFLGHLWTSGIQKECEYSMFLLQCSEVYFEGCLFYVLGTFLIFLLLSSLHRHNAWKSRIHNFIQSPLSWSKTSRQETNEIGLQAKSLETFLSQKCEQAFFRDFLKSEFSEENMDFWLACQEFKTFDSPEELRRRAASIYEEFIRPDSPKQVNLDFHTRESIRLSLQQASPSCFVVAQRKIYSLMENGAFPRFIQSEQYKALFSATSQPRGLGKHSKALKVKRGSSG